MAGCRTRSEGRRGARRWLRCRLGAEEVKAAWAAVGGAAGGPSGGEGGGGQGRRGRRRLLGGSGMASGAATGCGGGVRLGSGNLWRKGKRERARAGDFCLSPWTLFAKYLFLGTRQTPVFKFHSMFL